MKSKPHPNYVSQVSGSASSPWPFIFIIGTLVSLYLYLEKGYSGFVPTIFGALLVFSLVLKTRAYSGTVCPECNNKIPVDIPYKEGKSFTAKCSRCNINWDLGMTRQPWVNYNDHWND